MRTGALSPLISMVRGLAILSLVKPSLSRSEESLIRQLPFPACLFCQGGAVNEAEENVTIDGIETASALKIIAEVGIDMSRWKSDKHFASWMALPPGAKISGGKVLSSATKKVANRAAQAFRLAAYGLTRSKSALGAYFRRQKARLGAPKAITATAHKLARLVYAMLKNGTSYADVGQDYYEERYQARLIQNLKRKAKHFGFELTPTEGKIAAS